MMALQFSGGKDSLACLYMYRKQWDELYVVWVNTGAAYPDVIEFMEGWKNRLPHFIEVKTNQPEQVKEHGWPSDVVPLRYTKMGRIVGMDSPFLIQGWMACCGENIWLPMREAIINLGVTTVIRGQRNDEARKGLLRNGEVVDGITYLYPIENWTAQAVFKYLHIVGAEIPAYYELEQTSRDCWDCTGFLDENRARIENLPEERRREIKRRLALMSEAVAKESRWLTADTTPTLQA